MAGAFCVLVGRAVEFQREFLAGKSGTSGDCVLAKLVRSKAIISTG